MSYSSFDLSPLPLVESNLNGLIIEALSLESNLCKRLACVLFGVASTVRPNLFFCVINRLGADMLLARLLVCNGLEEEEEEEEEKLFGENRVDCC